MAEVRGALPTVRSRLENGFPSPSSALQRAAGAVRAASARVRAPSGAVRVPSKVGKVICTWTFSRGGALSTVTLSFFYRDPHFDLGQARCQPYAAA